MGVQIVSLITGIIFGACLILAGFTDPDRIIRALKLKDYHIIRSVILIILIAIFGTWLIKFFGTIEISNKPAAIITLTLGGLLFGAGMGFTGYTPGTSLAGVASGRIDALFTFFGMFFGAYVYVFIYPPLIKPLELILNYEKTSLPELTHIPDVIWVIFFSVFGLIVLFFTIIKFPVTKTINQDSDKNHQEQIFSDLQIPELLSNENDFSIKTDFFDSAQILNTWKNVFFFITMICLIMLQFFFWIVIKTDTNTDYPESFLFRMSPEHVSVILNISNMILIFSTIFYVLMVFFCLSVSFSTNLGGLKYISRAFFSALVALVLLFPWQILFGKTIYGAIYTPSELFTNNLADAENSFSAILLYLRFVGYWAIVIFLLIRAQVYTRKWMQLILGRIEQII